VERSSGDLEADASEDEHQADDNGRVEAGIAAGVGLGDAGVAGGAGRAVDEREAVEEERAGEGAEEDVLEAGFVGAEVALEDPDEDVEGEGEDFEGEVGGEQLGGAGHDGHGGAGDEEEAVELAVVDALLALEEFGGHEGDDEDDAGGEEAEEAGEIVAEEEPLVGLGVAVEEGESGAEPGERAEGCQVGEDVLPELRREEFDGDDQEGDAAGDVLGDEEGVVAHVSR